VPFCPFAAALSPAAEPVRGPLGPVLAAADPALALGAPDPWRPLPAPVPDAAVRVPPVAVFAEPGAVFAAPDAGRSELCVARGWLPVAAAVAPAACAGSTVQLRNMKYCWPSVHRFVVTQYSTSPYCQYRPVSEKNGTRYIMYFCDWAIGLSGSTLVCMRPRLELCRTVMNVVVALITTVTAATIEGPSPIPGVCGNSSLSYRCTPKIVALCALSSTGTVSPYLGTWPGFHSAISRST